MKLGVEKIHCVDDPTCTVTVDKFSENTVDAGFDTNVHYTLSHVISFTSLDELGTKRTALQKKLTEDVVTVDNYEIGKITRTFSKINSIRGHSLTMLINFWLI